MKYTIWQKTWKVSLVGQTIDVLANNVGELFGLFVITDDEAVFCKLIA